MKPKTELLFRKGARTVAWLITATVIFAGIAGIMVVVVAPPVLQRFFIAILAGCATTGTGIFILWATGNENEKRISKLKCLLNEGEKWHN